MSSEFYVNKRDLEENGVLVYPNEEDYTEVSLNFPNYEYLRSAYLSFDDSESIQISCSGEFRNWLYNFLKEKGINYAVYW